MTLDFFNLNINNNTTKIRVYKCAMAAVVVAAAAAAKDHLDKYTNKHFKF
jgi:hypothetical protein